MLLYSVIIHQISKLLPLCDSGADRAKYMQLKRANMLLMNVFHVIFMFFMMYLAITIRLVNKGTYFWNRPHVPFKVSCLVTRKHSEKIILMTRIINGFKS